MDHLSERDKVALARQFNLIVRAFNEYQIKNWAKLCDHDFDVLIKKEKQILQFVERLLNSATKVNYKKPSSLVAEVESFSDDLKKRLENSQLPEATNLLSNTSVLASAILSYTTAKKNKISNRARRFFSF